MALQLLCHGVPAECVPVIRGRMRLRCFFAGVSGCFLFFALLRVIFAFIGRYAGFSPDSGSASAAKRGETFSVLAASFPYLYTKTIFVKESFHF